MGFEVAPQVEELFDYCERHVVNELRMEGKLHLRLQETELTCEAC